MTNDFAIHIKMLYKRRKIENYYKSDEINDVEINNIYYLKYEL